VQGDEKRDTPCPRNGCYGKLYDMSAKILFVGCSLKTNTIIHGVEEWNGIPNRLTDTHQQLKIRTPDGRLIDRPLRRHHHPSGDVSRNYDKIEDALLETGTTRLGRIGNAKTYVCDARRMVSSEEWVRLAGEYTMDPTTTGAYLYLYFNGDPTASYYIDDFRLTQLAPGLDSGDAAGASEQRLEFSFEGSTEGWGPRGSGVVVEVVKDEAVSGEYSLKTTNRSAAWHGAAIDLMGVLEQDVTYETTGYLRLTERPSTTSTIRLTMEQQPVGEATGWRTVAQAYVADTEWVQLSGRYTSVEEMQQRCS
jgi:hypothetical protein